MAEFRVDSDETRALLEQSREDRGVFDQLFSRHREALRRAVASRFDRTLQGRLDPSDVVQEAQLEAFRRLPDYLGREPMPFFVWLRKMAIERLIMLRRKHLGASRRAVSLESPLPAPDGFPRQLHVAARSPSQELLRGELVQRVREAMVRLSEKDREILHLRVFELLSHDEIASRLGIEPAAARQRHGRALMRLRSILADAGVTGSRA